MEHRKPIIEKATTPAAKQKEAQVLQQGADQHWSSLVWQILFHSQWPVIIGLIFGGCCSNVFTLEALVSEQPDSGYLLTVTQFIFVAVEGYFQFFDSSRGLRHGYLAERKVPILKWLQPVLLFFAVSTLNNYVWIYSISVPVHIIFRSGGTVFTMVAGMLTGKKYSFQQILSVFVLTVGVIVATLASNPSKSKKSGDDSQAKSSLDFAIGVGILAIAAVLSAIQGLVAEQIYKECGKHWRESLFYTHLLSLPFFVFFSKDIYRQFKGVMSSPSYVISLKQLSEIQVFSNFFPTTNIADLSFKSPPWRLVLLLLNAGTQYFCVRGVNNLAGNFTALTVSIVLNIRKFVSLILSIYLFGNHLSLGTMVGAVLVFFGAGMYSYSSGQPKKQKSA